MPSMALLTLKEREAKFMAEHIRDMPREALAQELFGIYLFARAECPDIDDDHEDDTWPMNLHLADVLDKYVFRDR